MKIKYHLAIIFLASFASGCASTSGSHNLLSESPGHAQTANFKELVILVKPAPGIQLYQGEEDRISKRIARIIKTEAPDRFKNINPSLISPNTLQATVVMTQYEKGSSFTRILLDGLGQIHIDADVTISDYASKDTLAKHEVTKTFAWGGTASIYDAEEGFSKAVAEAILGKD